VIQDNALILEGELNLKNLNNIFFWVDRRNDKYWKLNIQNGGIEVRIPVMMSDTINFDISKSWVRICGHNLQQFNSIIFLTRI
jgi:hypothetical protein